MILILKIILGLMALADMFVFRFVIKDFIKIKKTDGYDVISLWEKIKFSSIFCFISVALVSLFLFLIYFVIIPIQIL